MHNSGTKLVIAITGLALLLGGISWWYRYEAAHRATQFWGGEESRLIAESAGLEAITFEPGPTEILARLKIGSPELDSSELHSAEIDLPGQSVDLGKARGQAHLRHALMSDRNYVWGEQTDTTSTEWRWCLRFYEGQSQVVVVLSDDLTVIGKYEPATQVVAALSCQPMTASLAAYFRALGL